MDETDKKIVRVTQEDFPLVREPYAELASRIGISEDTLLRRLQEFRETGRIRKMGAVLQHHRAGFASNVLCAWEVPMTRVDEIAGRMSRCPSVSHCYDRNTRPGWPFNLYTMIHGHSRSECEKIAADLGEANGIEHRAMLYTVKEWKKSSMKYFVE
jgi:DNA-binding Lrp family transcriptional regulator